MSSRQMEKRYQAEYFLFQPISGKYQRRVLANQRTLSPWRGGTTERTEQSDGGPKVTE